ncbi:CoA transferase [Roseibium aquae]|uniref:CoA transferase n=1 Tax=Roseibium aquae TaxID=1323746 RepID=A0A916TI22_9HYPH|nr:CoA transferase [Roseibium aquae]GGB45192.1 CoA transferase [Roseibium aquae]
MQPLEGLTVLDFTTLLPGPLASLMLAEAGARVIKVERPGGEDMRRFPPFVDGQSVLFAQLNAGKQIVTLDLKTSEDRRRLDLLIAGADVLLEQFRPGVMARLGLDYETLSARQPGLIYCSISGYGQTGPRAGAAGHDLNYQALTGLLAQSCGTAAHPALPPAQIADIGGGSFPAVMNILLAVLQRQKTGRGCHLDVAMSDAMFTFGLFAQAQRIARVPVDEHGTGLLTGGSPRYRLYPASDDRQIAVAALEDKFWWAFCDVIGLPDALRDDRKDPGATAAAVAGIIASRSSDDWGPMLEAADCCVCVVRQVHEARADPHFVDRWLFSRTISPGDTAMEQIVLPVDRAFRG